MNAFVDNYDLAGVVLRSGIILNDQDRSRVEQGARYPGTNEDE